MNDPVCSDREMAKVRLSELVLDHLGIPRPGQSRLIQELQDGLLPSFIDTSRQAWLAVSSMHRLPNDLMYRFDSPAMQQEVRALNDALEELGVHDLLRDIAASPYANALDDLPVDPYEERLLKAAGHPRPTTAMRELLCLVALERGMLAAPNRTMEEASHVTLNIAGDLNIVMNQPQPPSPAGPPSQKPKRYKLFSGVGKLFSGLALLAGNGIMIPTVAFASLAALPLLGSFAGGIAAVGDGVGQLRREGE